MIPQEILRRLKRLPRPMDEEEFDPSLLSPRPLEAPTPITEPSPKLPRLTPDSEPINLGRIMPEEIDPATQLKLRRNAPLDFGLDEQGAMRTKPDSGFGGRLMSGLKSMGRIGLQAIGEGGLPAAMVAGPIGFARGVADPSLPAKLRRMDALNREQSQLEQDQTYRGNEARIADMESQAQPRLERPKYDWFPKDTDEDGIPDEEEYRVVEEGAVRQLPRKLGVQRQPLVRTKTNADGTVSTLVSEDGKTWNEVPGLLSHPKPKEEKADTSGFTNAQLEKSIREASTERDRIGASLKDVPPTITSPGRYEGDPPSAQPNPAYTDLMQRYRQLDDKIRDWRTRMKPTSTQGGGKKWSASRWAQANPNGDVTAAKAEAKRRGFEVVD